MLHPSINQGYSDKKSKFHLYLHLDPEHGTGGDAARLVGGAAHVDPLVPGVDTVKTHPPVTDNLDPVRKTLSALATPADVWCWVTSNLKQTDKLENHSYV